MTMIAAAVHRLIGNFDPTLPAFLEHPDPDVYLRGPWIVVDFETTNLEKGSPLHPGNRLVCSAWATSYDRQIHHHRGDEFDQEKLMSATQEVLKSGGFIIAHNVKFELGWYSRMGLDLYTALTYDTMLGEYVRGGNRWKYQHLTLDKLNKKYGGTGKMRIVDAMIKGGVCPSEIRPDLLKARVCKDVSDTMRIFHRQVRLLKKRDQLKIAYTRNLATPCLTWIEQRGIALNRERVYEEYQRAHAKMVELQAQLDKFTGGINWKSAPQKAKFLYGRKRHPEEELQVPNGLGFAEVKGKRNKASKQFPNGQPKTDDTTLGKLRARTKRQTKFLALLKEAGSINAQLTKTLEFFKGVVDEYDGVFYGAFNQYNTATHRLSSSGRKLVMQQFLDKHGHPKAKSAQFQNMPRAFKDLMQPKREGWRMGEVDGSQLEFRVAAFLGRDSVAAADIRGDVDIHLFTASVLNAVEIPDVTKLMRQDAKPDTFKPLYGGKSGTPAQVRYYEAFRAKYSQIFDEQTSWTYTVLKHKKLRTPWGLEYHWPRTRMSNDGYIDNTPSIFNYPVQAFATAEIIPVALVFLWHRLRANEAATEIVNTVHDSAIAEIPPGEERLFQQLSLRTFTVDVYRYLGEVYDIQFDVPLGAGITIGDRWSSPDGVETEVNVEPNGDVWFKGERSEVPTSKSRDAWNTIAGMAA
jgi:DNA polymerase I-like protein with 3'-5' exonuclease and polymerase domains